MAKAKKAIFFCSACGHETPKWLGRCPGCGAWNTMTEQEVAPAPSRAARMTHSGVTGQTATPLSAISEEAGERTPTGIAEFDRVLGGGLVPGSLVLVGGDPGIGKSTLLLQASAKLCGLGLQGMYVTGEESGRQIRMRAKRLGVEKAPLLVLAENDVARVLDQALAHAPEFMVVDSIQTMQHADLSGGAGSVSQVRECAAYLMRHAKESGCATLLVGHVTKEGSLAGPRVLEHMVDAVLYFEGDRNQNLRILRAAKNRFGSVDEIGLFRMDAEGMVEVENPSEALLRRDTTPTSGCCVYAALEGSRPVLVDLQALVAPTAYGNPRRAVSGMELQRVQLLLAVLERRCGMKLSAQDAYVNVAGGLELTEPAADLALCLAVASSYTDRPLPENIAVCGEVGLSGEVRAVPQLSRRMAECARLGFSTAVVPAGTLPPAPEGLKLMPVASLRDALKLLKP